MRRLGYCLPAALLLCVLAAAGCGKPGVDYAQVAGRITLDGKPLPNAKIMFIPLNSLAGDPAYIGMQSAGITDADGRFELGTYDRGPGAVVGEHKVVITLEPDAAPGAVARTGYEDVAEDMAAPPGPFKSTIPARYNSNTELRFAVPPKGVRNAVFELTTR
jgi:hypothetical protein